LADGFVKIVCDACKVIHLKEFPPWQDFAKCA